MPWPRRAWRSSGRGEKLEDLDDRKRLGADPQAIRALALPIALAHGIAGRYTSFVAVQRGHPGVPGGEEAGAAPAERRKALVQPAALRISGPATAAGWKLDLLIAAVLLLAGLLMSWHLLRGQGRRA